MELLNFSGDILKDKLCLGLNSQFGLDDISQVKLFKKCGFDGFFANYESGMDLMPLRELADELGMIFQSIHAPFYKMHAMWNALPETDACMKELSDCLYEAKRVNVGLVIVHAFIGFNDHSPTEFGVKKFDELISLANDLGITLAFENTEGEEYLAKIFEKFRHRKNVGFCWDTGHELCYNRGQDMMALYGDKLVCTHLNDNLGVTDSGGKITWLDDLHLIPFDGVTDWESVAKRLNESGFADELTFELNTESKPDRHENDEYSLMGIENYVALSYARAKKFLKLKNNLTTKQK